MNWQEFFPMIVVLGVAVFFVWRSSGQKKPDHEHGCGCSCHHEAEAETKKQNSAPR